jgi:oligopeptide transport system substrate-binding protein
VSIEQINFSTGEDGSRAFARYEAGEWDLCGVPWGELPRVKADPDLSKELRIVPFPCTQYLGFNTSKPPLDNVKVRQALSYAIDRQKLIRNVFQAEHKPAKSFACPGIFGSPAEDASFKGIEFDPAKGRALLAEAGFPDGKGLPDITYMSWTGEYRQEVAEFIRQGWKENLGIDVKLADQEWSLYLKTVNTDTPQIYAMGWCADYMDESNWVMAIFHTAKSSNNPKWYGAHAEAFDKLVEDAGSASDPAVRKKKYYEAERLLCVEDAVIAPLFYVTVGCCVKPYVEGAIAPMGGDWIYYWKVREH